jgi:hypothetical protein
MPIIEPRISCCSALAVTPRRYSTRSGNGAYCFAINGRAGCRRADGQRLDAWKLCFAEALRAILPRELRAATVDFLLCATVVAVEREWVALEEDVLSP